MSFIPVAAPIIGARELAYVTDAVQSGWVSSIGAYLERFEQAFAEYVGVTRAVAVSNGTVGLYLALYALGIGPGDEVIIPDLTFVATAHAVIQTGATPVFVDVEPDTWCIDPEAVRQAITPATRAIIPVHLYGHAADMDAINQLAEQYGLLVVEDAAEAHGAELAGQRVGGLGQVGVFSFYGNKIMTTGEGGILTTNDAILADRLRYLKDHGMSPAHRYYHTELAFNYRMTNLQAALGVAQLEQIEEFIAKKRQIARWYREVLEAVPSLQLPVERAGTRNVYWLFSIVLKPELGVDRQELSQSLRRRGIDSRPFFVPMHSLPHLTQYRTVGREGSGCPRAASLGAHGMNLPSGCNLNEETVKYVAQAVANLLSGAA